MAAHSFRPILSQSPVLEPRGASLEVPEYNLPGKFSDWLCLYEMQYPDARNIVIGWCGSHGYPILR